MNYPKLHSDIRSWADSNSIIILEEDVVPGRLYFYLSSDVGETFQIVIEPEVSDKARIDAHLIESLDDEGAHFVWEFPWPKVIRALDLSVESARIWLRRNAG